MAIAFIVVAPLMLFTYDATLHLPRIQRIKHGVLRMKAALFAVTYKRLSGAGLPEKSSYVAELRPVFHQASPSI